MFMVKADLKFTVFYYRIIIIHCKWPKFAKKSCVRAIMFYHIWMQVKIISNETVDIFLIDITIQMDSG